MAKKDKQQNNFQIKKRYISSFLLKKNNVFYLLMFMNMNKSYATDVSFFKVKHQDNGCFQYIINYGTHYTVCNYDGENGEMIRASEYKNMGTSAYQTLLKEKFFPNVLCERCNGCKTISSSQKVDRQFCCLSSIGEIISSNDAYCLLPQVYKRGNKYVCKAVYYPEYNVFEMCKGWWSNNYLWVINNMLFFYAYLISEKLKTISQKKHLTDCINKWNAYSTSLETLINHLEEGKIKKIDACSDNIYLVHANDGTVAVYIGPWQLHRFSRQQWYLYRKKFVKNITFTTLINICPKKAIELRSLAHCSKEFYKHYRGYLAVAGYSRIKLLVVLLSVLICVFGIPYFYGKRGSKIVDINFFLINLRIF